MRLSLIGGRIELQVSERLRVELAGSWTPPQRGGCRVDGVVIDAGQGYPEPGPARVLFTAVRKGARVMRAHTDYACF